MSVLDFLRDIGKHFPVNRMLARDVVAPVGGGISYTEFSYVLLQSLDYLELYRSLRLHAPVRGQRPVGTSPPASSWSGAPTAPGCTRSPRRCSPRPTGPSSARPSPARLARSGHDVAVRVPPVLPQRRGREGDRVPQGVQRAQPAEIDELERQTREQPHRRAAQRALADDVTALVHSPGERDAAVGAAAALFGRSDMGDPSESVLAGVVAELAGVTIPAGTGLLPIVAEVLTAVGWWRASRRRGKRSPKGVPT